VNGAKPVLVDLDLPGYIVNWQKVKAAVSDKTKAIIINSPHNPTGSVLSADDIQHLRSIVQGTNIFIVSDEVYEHIVFDNAQHQSILRYPDLYERSFVCFSFGKAYHCTGWKVGYCVAPPALTKEFIRIHQFNAFSTNSTVQVALAEYLLKEEAYTTLGSVVQQKRDYFQNLMLQTKLKPLPTSGSYFQLYSYAGVTNEKEKEFAVRLTRDYGVAAIPLAAFYQDNVEHQLLRFCFVKKESTLEAAVNRLMTL
jgi:methionine aminotransferase